MAFSRPFSAVWWLQLFASMFACAVLYGLYRYRLTRLLEMERLRTRIATDLHDDIGSTLSQIAILSGGGAAASRW
jgi:signal transduction histidine kinase